MYTTINEIKAQVMLLAHKLRSQGISLSKALSAA